METLQSLVSIALFFVALFILVCTFAQQFETVIVLLIVFVLLVMFKMAINK